MTGLVYVVYLWIMFIIGFAGYYQDLAGSALQEE